MLQKFEECQRRIQKTKKRSWRLPEVWKSKKISEACGRVLNFEGHKSSRRSHKVIKKQKRLLKVKDHCRSRSERSQVTEGCRTFPEGHASQKISEGCRISKTIAEGEKWHKSCRRLDVRVEVQEAEHFCRRLQKVFKEQKPLQKITEEISEDFRRSTQKFM